MTNEITTRKLMPFQELGIQFLSHNLTCILGDEMGLGKTVQALGLVNNCPHIRRVLIVCPASLKGNWVNEIKGWIDRLFKIEVLSGGTNKPITGNMVVVNYDILQQRLSDLLSPTDSRGKRWDLVIFDEAHYLKNTSTARTKAAATLIRYTHRLVFMTGTPVVNRPAELFFMLRACSPEWGNQRDFERKYCNARMKPIFWGSKKLRWDNTGVSNQKELHDKLQGFMLRRTKKEVLKDLPDKIHQIIELNVPEQYKALKDSSDKWWITLDKLPGSVTGLPAMRKECGLAKVPAAVEHIKNVLEEKQKVVIMAHHRDVVAALHTALGKYGPVMLTGDTAVSHRAEIVKKFQTDQNIRVFIGNIQAAGVGITLTASDIVIFVELDWVPGNMQQAEDRCHRIGQKSNVLVQYLVAPGVDAAIGRALAAKIEVIKEVL